MSYAHVNGIDLYFERTGSGLPLVLLHGWGTSGRVWNAQLAALADEFTVVTVDWRGCGRSDRPRHGNTVAQNGADVLALADALGLDAPVLVGNSIGATMALEAAAAAAPGRLAGVVSVDGPGYWPREGMAAELAALRTGLRVDRAATVAGWVPGWYQPGTSPHLVDWTVRQILDSGVFIDELFTEAADYDPRPLLAALDLPVAFVHGEQDTQIPAEVSRTLAAATPRAEFHLVHGTAHLPHQDRPAELAALLAAFTRRCASSAGQAVATLR